MESEKLRLSLDAARDFITRSINPAGYWSDFQTLAGESVYWVTGYVGFALARGHVPRGVEVERSKTMTMMMLSQVGTRLLQAQQLGEGGWGYCPGVPADADSTSWCLLFLSTLDKSLLQNQEAIVKRAVSFLLKHQSPVDGGFRTYAVPRAIGRYMSLDGSISFGGWSSSQTCVTGAATKALLQVEEGSAQEVSSALDYIRRTQTPDGYWNAYWWTDDLYSTILCAEALAEGGLARIQGSGDQEEEDSSRLRRARLWIAKTQLPDGSWQKSQRPDPGGGWPFSTALALRGLMLAQASISRETARAIEQGLQWLLAHQSSDGSWGDDYILRIPDPSSKEPWKQSEGWKEGGRAIGALIKDQRRLYTTATVFSALTEFEKRWDEER